MALAAEHVLELVAGAFLPCLAMNGDATAVRGTCCALRDAVAGFPWEPARRYKWVNSTDWDAWAACFPSARVTPTLMYRAKDVQDTWRALRGLRNLRTVRIRGEEMTLRGQPPPHITTLSLSKSRFADGGASLIVTLLALPRLQSLDLSYCNLPMSVIVALPLQQLPRLTMLNLEMGCCEVMENQTEAWRAFVSAAPQMECMNVSLLPLSAVNYGAVFQAMPNLRSLRVCRLYEEEYHAVGRYLRSTPRMEELEWGLALDDVFLDTLPALQCLKALCIDNVYEMDAVLSVLVVRAVRMLPRLQLLDLTDFPLGAEGALCMAEALRAVAWPKLEALCLSHCQLGRGTDALVAALQYAPCLARLDLSGTQASLDALVAMANACGALRKLDLFNCQHRSRCRTFDDAILPRRVPLRIRW